MDRIQPNCIPVINDKVYVWIVKHHFLKIYNRVTVLDLCQKLVFAQYLENECTEFNKTLYTYYH